MGASQRRTKSGKILLKRFICNALTLAAHRSSPARPDWGPSIRQNSSISHIRRQALPAGFIYQRAEKTVRRKARHQPRRPCLGIRRCKCTTNKFPPQHNGGLPRQGDEMRKEDGGRRTKVDGKPVRQLVSKRIPHT